MDVAWPHTYLSKTSHSIFRTYVIVTEWLHSGVTRLRSSRQSSDIYLLSIPYVDSKGVLKIGNLGMVRALGGSKMTYSTFGPCKNMFHKFPPVHLMPLLSIRLQKLNISFQIKTAIFFLNVVFLTVLNCIIFICLRGRQRLRRITTYFLLRFGFIHFHFGCPLRISVG